ncbi:MAG TPA: hypothetical protein VFU09_14195, partial [Candidatus Udaeobacter sp.]|nr:hypothetical protein [Candidatus Udaeobacter sp.]
NEIKSSIRRVEWPIVQILIIKERRADFARDNASCATGLTCFRTAFGMRTRPRVAFYGGCPHEESDASAHRTPKLRSNLRKRENTESVGISWIQLCEPQQLCANII